MANRKLLENIELRSEEVQDILSRPPHWMVRSGSTVLILIILLVFVLSYFIKYPEVIEVSGLVPTHSTHVHVLSPEVSGRVTKLTVRENQVIGKGATLAELEMPFTFEDLEKLKTFLKRTELLLEETQPSNFEITEDFNFLGKNIDYVELRKSMKEYTALFNEANSNRLLTLKEAQSGFLQLKEALLRKRKLNESQIGLSQKRLNAYADSGKQNDFLKEQARYDELISQESEIDIDLIKANIQISDSKLEVVAFELEKAKQINLFHSKIKELIRLLRIFIFDVENDHLLRSPVEGRVEFLGRLRIGQFVKEEDSLFAILRLDDKREVELRFPYLRSERMKLGQTIKLTIHGLLNNGNKVMTGEIVRLEPFPDDGYCNLGVRITGGSFSSLILGINSNPDLIVDAEIQTEDIRLMKKFFESARQIFK